MDSASTQPSRYHGALADVHGGAHGGHLSIAARPEREGLIDVLDRVLDKGVVIAGDIRINLLDIELLTIKVRLLISSADKARELGIDWWSRDPHLSGPGKGDDAEKENKALRERVERLEAQLKSLTDRGGAGNRQSNGAGGSGAQGRRGS